MFPPRHPFVVPGAIAPLVLAAAAWAIPDADARLVHPVTALLAAGVAAATLLAIHYRGSLWLCGPFTFCMLAVVFQGAAAAFAVVLAGAFGSWAVERHRSRAFLVSGIGAGVPTLVAGTVLELALPSRSSTVAFAATLTLAATLALALNFVIVGTLKGSVNPRRPCPNADTLRHLLAAILWSLVFTVVLAGAFRNSDPAAVAMAALVALGFASMIAAERHEIERESGVLWGLVTTLKQRDAVAAHHAAAVSCYARAIALQLGLPPSRCDQAHVAGLLHDVGTIGLRDGATAGHGRLDLDDWRAIRRHPEVGAALLRGLGDIAEAVFCHHERIDGRGYPRGLAAEEIPLLARIVGVAEVYDTLTAADSYRRMRSSLEALVELRRVAGTQLDARCVEALAVALAGKPEDYRRAASVDIDEELARHALMVGPAAARAARLPA